MIVVMALSGLGLLAAPALLHGLGRRLSPPEWARLVVLALAGGAAVLETALLLLASPTWVVLPPLPAGIRYFGVAAATGPDGRIYVVGGGRGGLSFDNSMEVYTPGAGANPGVGTRPRPCRCAHTERAPASGPTVVCTSPAAPTSPARRPRRAATFGAV